MFLFVLLFHMAWPFFLRVSNPIPNIHGSHECLNKKCCCLCLIIFLLGWLIIGKYNYEVGVIGTIGAEVYE